MVKGDLRDQEGMEACLRSFQPDEIYNFASPSSPAASWEMPVDVGDITALGVTRLLESVRRAAQRARFYQASSSELFGEPLEAPQGKYAPSTAQSWHPKLYAHWMTVHFQSFYAVRDLVHREARRGLGCDPQDYTARSIRLGLADELHLGDLDAS
jgi:GDPmannose 4,6-dehydratase